MAVLLKFRFVGILLLGPALAPSVNKWFFASEQGDKLNLISKISEILIS